MAPAASASLKPMPLRARRPLLAVAPLAAAAVVMTCWSLAPVAPGFVPSSTVGAWSSGPSRFAGGSSELSGTDSSHVALGARKYKGSFRFPGYDGYVHKKHDLPGIRIRLDRWGTSHHPFYRIKASFQKSRPRKSGRYLENIGWYDPMREVEDPKFFSLKADRAIYWLRAGAHPTDMVASLLDRAGIIRRTGPYPKMGEWEWRVPKTTGPDAPEGWSYDAGHVITWNNIPMIKHRWGHPHQAKTIRKRPIIERYGFTGYEKIPLDHDAMSEPLAGNSLLHQLGNTELPIF